MHCFQYCIFRGLEVVSAWEQTPRNSCRHTYSEQPSGLHPLLCPGMLSSGRSKVISLRLHLCAVRTGSFFNKGWYKPWLHGQLTALSNVCTSATGRLTA